MATDVRQYLPQNIQNTFWKDFADSISEELVRLKTVITEKETLFDVTNLTNTERLLQIAEALGYIPDLSLDNSIQNAQDNVNSVVFRIKNKTAYVSYDYIFKTVPYTGEIFILYNEDNKLQRAAESIISMIGDIGTSTQLYNEPFVYKAEENYSSFLFSVLYLDSGLILDSNSNPWALDEFTSSLKTNHIAIEYGIDRIITREGVDYLMVSDYVEYLFNAVNYTRKVTEVPHVGAQLSLIMDNTGYYDSYSNGSDAYSIPDLKLSCSVTNQYVELDSATSVHKMVIGNGSQELPSVNDGIAVYPTELENKIAGMELVTDETVETTNWKVFNTMFPANTISEEILATGDGDVVTVSGTLNVTNIKPYSVKITFISVATEYTIIDNGLGTLYLDSTQDYSVGTINYTTGVYSFSTEKLEDVELEVLSDISVDSLSTSLSHSLIEENSFTLYFKIGETGYSKSDNGGGGFIDTSTGLTSGSINYTTGELDVTFTSDTEPREAGTDEQGNVGGGITCEYQFTRQYEVNTSTNVLATYEINEDWEITEAGIEDASGNLLAYGTFPPIVFDNSRYHASFQFLILKDTFT